MGSIGSARCVGDNQYVTLDLQGMGVVKVDVGLAVSVQEFLPSLHLGRSAESQACTCPWRRWGTWVQSWVCLLISAPAKTLKILEGIASQELGGLELSEYRKLDPTTEH